MSEPLTVSVVEEPPKARGLSRGEIAAMAAVSAGMVAAASLRVWSWSEVAGFLTGGACVWLGVRQHVGTWPVGIVNNVVFFFVFWGERLYADAVLQTLYLSLSLYGWWSWRAAPGSKGSAVSRTRAAEWVAVVAGVPLATWATRELLLWGNGSAPFWDALTAALSLAAQALMCRKRLENWLVWIVADLVYIPLYVRRHLPLTAILYAVFLAMCIAGWRAWRRDLLARGAEMVS